jgi:hypothetical protein
MKIDDEAVTNWWRDLLTRHPGIESVIERLALADEEAELLPLLHRVARSRTEDWQRASREDLRDLIATVKKAGTKLRSLKSSQVGRLIFPSMDDIHSVCQQLDAAIRNAGNVMPFQQKKHTPRTDSAIAGVVLYVEKKVGKPCDREVGTLLSAILGKQVNMKRWRQLHSGRSRRGVEL